MKRTVVATIVAILLPVAIAAAHVAIHGSAKLPVVRAGFDDPTLTNRLIYDCYAANRSTANRAWAVTYFSGFTPKQAKECERVGVNGVSFVHEVNGGWHEVYSASDFPSCHLRGVPYLVVKDLSKSLPRGFGPAC
jgi:hypothetical protein